MIKRYIRRQPKYKVCTAKSDCEVYEKVYLLIAQGNMVDGSMCYFKRRYECILVMILLRSIWLTNEKVALPDVKLKWQ